MKPVVKIDLTEEQKRLAPDWEKITKLFQRQCDARTMEQRFRLCLHEGSHAIQYRKLWDVEFHGPYVYFEDGSLHCVVGAVSPPADIEPLPVQHAMVSIAGFTWVEHFTCVPNSPHTIQRDLQLLRKKLGEDGDMNMAVYSAEIMLENQLSEPTFILELERACRDYEMSVYGTDEATTWGWREYHPELLGKRHRVVVPYSGSFGTLVENEGDLKLIVEGEVFHVGDELRGVLPDVRTTEIEKAGDTRAVEKWNDAVSRLKLVNAT
jgi:hypothetical protein